MCGIFAVLSMDGRGIRSGAAEAVDRALESIRHRGPDARGRHVDRAGRFALGHVRLSVIDMQEASNQPFWSTCGRYFVVFNGEIYNYLELRAELEQIGERFATASDTEVLLRAVARWGPECVSRFNGMWAFVWGDIESGRIVVSRDRWGVKPLYVQQLGGELVFCSEAKGIFAYSGSVPSANPMAVGLYLRFGIGGESSCTWFDGVERFPVATVREYLLDSDHARLRSESRFWAYPTDRTIDDGSWLRDEFERLLESAVSLRLRSDVPVGISLSGGLDSSVVAALVAERSGQRLCAFTAWFEPMEESELSRAERIAAMFGHDLIPVAATGPEQVMQDLRTAIWHLEAGHASPAIVPYLNLCRAARSRLSVMLEGQGADELLAGYVPFQTYAAVDDASAFRIGPALDDLRASAGALGLKGMALDLVRFTSLTVHTQHSRRWGASSLLTSATLSGIPDLPPPIRLGGGNVARLIEYQHRHNLTNLLQYGDAISMAVNLETRCPFLDYRLVELGFRASTRALVNGGFGKVLLRRVAEGFLPRDVCWDRVKKGFVNRTRTTLARDCGENGLPRDGLEWCVRAGILQAECRQVDRIRALPLNTLFRLASLCLWAEVFQTRSSVAISPADL
jgi:asparagine synthase (glutamine-hydrolysing)